MLKKNGKLIYNMQPFSLIWALMCADIMSIVICPKVTHYVDYFVFCAVIILGLFLFKKTLNFDENYKGIFISFFLFIGIQVVGLIAVHNNISFRNIISSCCALLWLTYLIYGKIEFQKKFIRVIYLVTIIIGLLIAADNRTKTNVLPAAILYITMSYLFIEFEVDDWRKKINYSALYIVLMVALFIAVAFYSRTTIISLCIIFAVFYLSHYTKITSNFYLCMVVALVLGCIAYTHIESMPFFSEIDEFLARYTGKQIASGRNLLWKVIFDKVDGYRFFIGLGTGILPDVFMDKVPWDQRELFRLGSCHSTYVQIFLQNGILGLISFFYMMYLIFKKFIKNSEMEYGKLATACLTGILAYNCFECTLLQNKFFIGLIQWTIIGIAYRKIILKNQGNEEVADNCESNYQIEKNVDNRC